MKALLQIRPLGIPLHSSATHFAFALMASTLFLDALTWFSWGGPRDTNGANIGAYALVIAGLVVTVVAALAALAATLDLPDDVRGMGWLYTGALAAIAVIDVVNAYLRNLTLRDQAPPPIPVFLSLLTFVVLLAAAWLGGQLVEREFEDELAQEEVEPEPIRRRRRR